MDLQLLEEELDNIDSPMAGEMPSKQTRPNKLQLKLSNPSSTEAYDSDWKLMDVSFGIPLFDMELNNAITNKILEGDLVTEESLKALRDSSEKVKEGLLEFIKENSQEMPTWLADEDVPFPTNPVWFDGNNIKPLGNLYNKQF